MPVSMHQRSEGDIREYEICPEIGTPYKLLSVQVGRYADEKRHYVSVLPQDEELDAPLQDICNEIQQTGMVEEMITRREVDVDYSLPKCKRKAISRLYEIELVNNGGRIAPFNQLDCFQQLLNKLAYHNLCSKEDALKVCEMELSRRRKQEGMSR